MTAPRRVMPQETIHIARRTAQRQFLLRPDEHTNAVFTYCLALAAERFNIGLIAWCLMSNHYHVIAHDHDGRLPEFLEYFHQMVARAMNARWGRRENFWAGATPTSVTRLTTDETIFEKVCYVVMNPVRAYLVDRLSDWPGCSSLYQRVPRKVSRPRGFFRPNGPTPEQVTLWSMVPPGRQAAGESAKAWATRLEASVLEMEDAVRQKRLLEKKRVWGRKAVLKLVPSDTPATAQPRIERRPTLAGKDKDRLRNDHELLHAFYEAYEAARIAFAEGNRAVLFPPGTYLLRRRCKVNCANDDVSAAAA